MPVSFCFPAVVSPVLHGVGFCHWDVVVNHPHLLSRPVSTTMAHGCHQEKNIGSLSTSTSFLSCPTQQCLGVCFFCLAAELLPLFWTSPGWLLEGRHDDWPGRYVIRIIPAHPCSIAPSRSSPLATWVQMTFIEAKTNTQAGYLS